MKVRTKVATGVVVAAVAITGTAAAAGAGPGGGLFGGPNEELAEDLASHLDGVSAEEVGDALEAVGEQRQEEHLTARAESLASQLDGVSTEEVAAALESIHQQARDSFENGERPEPGSLEADLASELGISEEELTAAMEAAREAGMDQHQAEMEQRLDDAVESGEITEEQAEQIRDRIENGGGPGGPGHHGPGDFGGHGPGGFDGPRGFGGPPPGAGQGGEEGASFSPPASAGSSI